jgi:Helix-turn-helix domain
MEEANQNPFLNVGEAGAFLRLKKRTLDNMRWMGTGPSFRKHGGRIYYHIDELKEWSLASRAKSTSQF